MVVRNRNGDPVVIENAPFMDDGRPMPTTFWLVDPGIREAVARIESNGGVRKAEAEIAAADIEMAHRLYRSLRDKRVGPRTNGPVPSGGVGGTRRGVKCLHAHVAWTLAGGDDPVGRWTLQRILIEEQGPALIEGLEAGVVDNLRLLLHQGTDSLVPMERSNV